MGISVKTDLEWGQKIYIKADEQQEEYRLVGIEVLPKLSIKFIISDGLGTKLKLYDFECSTEIDQLKKLESDKDED